MTIWERAGRIAEGMYDCKADIWIYEEKATPWGETRQEKKLLYEKVPCRMAKGRETFTAEGLILNGETSGILLFSTRFSIPKGSIAKVKRKDNTATVYHTVGVEKTYQTHKEVSLKEAERI